MHLILDIIRGQIGRVSKLICYPIILLNGFDGEASSFFHATDDAEVIFLLYDIIDKNTVFDLNNNDDWDCVNVRKRIRR